MSWPIRYLGRLAVVVVLIAALIGIGYGWRASPAASLVADGGRDRLPPGAPASADGNRFDRFDRFDRRGDGAVFSLGNIDDLLQTSAIGVGVLAGVVVIDKARRRRKPIRPATAATAATV